MTHDIRVGDMWRSDKGGRLVTVVPKLEYRGYGDVRDSRDVAYRGTTGAVMIALAVNFVRGRKLIERGGVRVGDVRAMGQASTLRVLSIEGDDATCETPDGTIVMSLAEVALEPIIQESNTRR
jgi:hypothetical protein